jgi:hypothetical protein
MKSLRDDWDLWYIWALWDLCWKNKIFVTNEITEINKIIEIYFNQNKLPFLWIAYNPVPVHYTFPQRCHYKLVCPLQHLFQYILFDKPKNKEHWNVKKLKSKVCTYSKIVFCRYNCLDLPWEKFFQVWVTFFSQFLRAGKVVQVRGRRLRICDLFETLFLLERTGKKRSKHLEKPLSMIQI